MHDSKWLERHAFEFLTKTFCCQERPNRAREVRSLPWCLPCSFGMRHFVLSRRLRAISNKRILVSSFCLLMPSTSLFHKGTIKFKTSQNKTQLPTNNKLPLNQQTTTTTEPSCLLPLSPPHLDDSWYDRHSVPTSVTQPPSDSFPTMDRNPWSAFRRL